MTYVYCVVRSRTAPDLAQVPRGLTGMSRPRALAIVPGLFAIVATAPERRYGEAAIRRGLSNIDWVSRAAVAHETVVAHFIDMEAVLPMKLLSMFSNDDRALEHLRSERARLVAAAKRVAGQHEWGVRVLFDRERAATVRPARTPSARGGLAYLTQKKVRRDAVTELASRSRDTAARLFERLAARAHDARRRSASDLPDRGSLLLDAAFLVPRTRAASFQALAARESRALSSQGYAVALTGPWPPYSFVQES